VIATSTAVDEVFFVEFRNSWSRTGTNPRINYAWDATTGRETVLDSDVSYKMIDNRDKTYSYNYTVDRPGDITINVIKYNLGKVYAEYYPNTAWSGNNNHRDNLTQIFFNSSSVWVYNNGSNDYNYNAWIKFYFRLSPPINASYTILGHSDESISLSINGTSFLSRSSNGNTSNTITLEAGEFYEWELIYKKSNSIATDYWLYWSYLGTSYV